MFAWRTFTVEEFVLHLTRGVKVQSILFVINTLGAGGGGEKALLELLSQMDLDKYEVHLFILTGQGELINQIPEKVKILNKKYFPISVLDRPGRMRLFKTVMKAMIIRGTAFKRMGYIINNLKEMIKAGDVRKDKLMWKILSDGAQRPKQGYDLAIAYLEGGAAYYVASYVKAKRKAAFIHIDYIYAGYTRKLDEECYLNFDHIYTVSESVKKTFLSVYPECKDCTTVFYNLINAEKIKRRSLEEGGFSDDYDGFRILTVGRLVPQKAIDVAIDTMKILQETGREFRWYVLGEGELRNKLEEKIHVLGLEKYFYLLGTVENPYPYFSQCDLYVHTANYEGKSIAVEEAQVLGCVMLVSDYAGVQEQVEDGIDGKICKCEPKALAENILDILGHPQQMKIYAYNASKKAQANAGSKAGKLINLLIQT